MKLKLFDESKKVKDDIRDYFEDDKGKKKSKRKKSKRKSIKKRK